MESPEEGIGDVFSPGGPLRADLLTQAATAALRAAANLAFETCWDSVRSPHIFMGLLAAPDDCVRDWGARLKADLPRLLGQFRELFQQEDDSEDRFIHLHREFISNNAIAILRDAYLRSRDQGRSRITPADLLISVLTSSDSIVAECFERVGIPATTLTQLAFMAERDRGPRSGGSGPGY